MAPDRTSVSTLGTSWEAGSGRTRISATPFHLALCEIQTPGELGLALVEEIIREHPETAIVLIEMHDAQTGQHVKRMGSIAAFLGDLLGLDRDRDGNGYPLGLSGEAIPLEGRIVAVVDVFDALLSDRCYWPAMSVEAVAATIREGRGTQFDPQIVDALLDHLDEALRLRSVHP